LAPDKIIRSEDEGRVYLWMPCDPKGALAPSDDAVRIEAPEPGTVRVTRSPTTSRSHEPMPRVSRTTSPPAANPVAANATASPATQPVAADPLNGHMPGVVGRNGQPVTNSVHGEPSTTSTPLEQAIELRNSLRQTLDQVSALVGSLKRQKRQQKLMQSTLATLRELRTAEAA
jgi:hypothetical protein